MMGMPAYSAYDSHKDSGEGWIEDVPAHWETRKLKHLFQEKKHRPNLALNCGSISFGEVVEKDDERVPLATKASYQEVSKGEFLVNPLNLNYDLKSLRIGLSDIDVVVSAGYLVLQAKEDMDKRYFKYLLHRYDVAYMKLLGSGVRQTISFNHIANSILVAPPLPEQRAIAAFLDAKCAKIDGAVKIKEDQIALLRERRQIIIQDAVTRGLNPAAPMKDSGIDWIGHVPSHWEVRRFRFLCSITTGGRNTEDKVGDGEYPFFVRSQTAERINSYSFDGEAVLTAGDGAGVGKVYHYYNGKFDFHQRVYKFSDFREVRGKYIFHYLDANFFNVALLGMAKSTVDSLRLPLIQNFWVAFPPDYDEQEHILQTIAFESGKIDEGIAIKERQIAALKEYKTSLINAAVTGKIKVI